MTQQVKALACPQAWQQDSTTLENHVVEGGTESHKSSNLFMHAHTQHINVKES